MVDSRPHDKTLVQRGNLYLEDQQTYALEGSKGRPQPHEAPRRGPSSLVSGRDPGNHKDGVVEKR